MKSNSPKKLPIEIQFEDVYDKTRLFANLLITQSYLTFLILATIISTSWSGICPVFLLFSMKPISAINQCRRVSTLLSVACGFSSTGKMGMLVLGSSGSVGLGCGFKTSATNYHKNHSDVRAEQCFLFRQIILMPWRPEEFYVDMIEKTSFIKVRYQE